MYYIGKVLHKDLDIQGHPIIELWDGVGYSLAEARRELIKINKNHIHQSLEIISDKEYDILSSKEWE